MAAKARHRSTDVCLWPPVTFIFMQPCVSMALTAANAGLAPTVLHARLHPRRKKVEPAPTPHPSIRHFCYLRHNSAGPIAAIDRETAEPL